MALSSKLGTPDDRSHTVIELGGLINAILGFGTAIGKDKLQRNELVIKLVSRLEHQKPTGKN